MIDAKHKSDKAKVPDKETGKICAPRAGPIGLPDDSAGIAVNVDCSDYSKQLSKISGDNELH